MATKRESRRRPPALSPEAAERRCIESAYSLAQRQLDEGTASPSVITHFLKMGTARAQYETEKLAADTELTKAKRVSIQKSDELQEQLSEAMAAMKRYRGHQDDEGDEEDYDDDW